ncbi:MAG: roadblock/LC7 domain-containing protein [Candidatus Hodarchaeota archaeon]
MITKKINETIKRFREHPGVRGVIVMSNEGLPISADGVDMQKAEKVAALITSLVGKAKQVITEIGEGTLGFFNIDCGKSEILVAPEEEYVLVVLREKLT